ncbi:DNA-binding protein [Nocardia aurantia]|uniref:PIN domain-containing protein n=1 Tax=Nocardia aurantia TaxID=2585199 RepID=A0A7K0DPE3_9NOCA|nr:DNA-binding protein [Nocardia aurantia]MQY26674.1 hypothetical protein [Nocardia aurantia]
MNGTVLLDGAGLAKLCQDDRMVNTLVAAAQRGGRRVGTTAMARLEAEHTGTRTTKVEWILSRLQVHAISCAVSDAAAELLRTHRLDGRRCAGEATLAAIARAGRPPVTVLTSDPGHLALMCGPGITVLRV